MLLGGGSKDNVLEEAGVAVAWRGREVEKYGGFSGGTTAEKGTSKSRALWECTEGLIQCPVTCPSCPGHYLSPVA